jgi:hypothetical protein
MMAQSDIFEPFFAVMVLTLIVWFYMYAKRIPFIVKNNFTNDQFKPEEFVRLSPPAVNNPSDNLKNLFELPLLFYVMCLYLFLTEQVDLYYLYAAWTFVVFRLLHSLVHCTFNLVILRFWLYCLSSMALFFMILRAVASVILY